MTVGYIFSDQLLIHSSKTVVIFFQYSGRKKCKILLSIYFYNIPCQSKLIKAPWWSFFTVVYLGGSLTRVAGTEFQLEPIWPPWLGFWLSFFSWIWIFFSFSWDPGQKHWISDLQLGNRWGFTNDSLSKYPPKIDNIEVRLNIKFEIGFNYLHTYCVLQIYTEKLGSFHRVRWNSWS